MFIRLRAYINDTQKDKKSVDKLSIKFDIMNFSHTDLDGTPSQSDQFLFCICNNRCTYHSTLIIERFSFEKDSPSNLMLNEDTKETKIRVIYLSITSEFHLHRVVLLTYISQYSITITGRKRGQTHPETN